MDDVQQGKQTHSKGQFLVSEPLAKSCIEVSPTLKFCPPPNSGWWLLSGAAGEFETDPLTQRPWGESGCRAEVRAAPPCSWLLVCSENTPCRGQASQSPPPMTLGKVLENNETGVSTEIWNPFQSHTGRKLGKEQQSL